MRIWKQEQLIEELTTLICDTYSIQIPIDNIEDVVSKIGGVVKYDGQCSYIEKNKNGFTICVEKNVSSKIKNFRVARQLGKLYLYTDFFLDKEAFCKSDTIVFDKSYYKEEPYGAQYYINEFARSLLMPEEEFIEEFNKNTDNNIVNLKAIATYFNVSKNDVENRGKSLGFFL